MSMLEIADKSRWVEISLNRPEVHNAFNSELIQDLTQFFQTVPKVFPEVRAVVLKGVGKSFSAGADLQYMKDMKSMTEKQNVSESEKLFKMFESVQSCALPVITKAHGSVYGGGLGLLACSDIVVAHKETQFCFSEGRLGLVPSVISSFVIPKIGFSKTLDLMISAVNFTADQAVQMNLIHFCGENEEIDDYVMSRVDAISSNGPEAVFHTKKLILELMTQNMTHDQIKDRTTKLIAERRVSAEGQEGLNSFFEKRKPTWRTKVER